MNCCRHTTLTILTILAYLKCRPHTHVDYISPRILKWSKMGFYHVLLPYFTISPEQACNAGLSQNFPRFRFMAIFDDVSIFISYDIILLAAFFEYGDDYTIISLPLLIIWWGRWPADSRHQRYCLRWDYRRFSFIWRPLMAWGQMWYSDTCLAACHLSHVPR